jgi:hypothetical protein
MDIEQDTEGNFASIKPLAQEIYPKDLYFGQTVLLAD